MIKVTENSIPLSAIARVEFDPVRLVYHPRAKREPQTACNAYVRAARAALMTPPLLNLPCTEAEAKRLRDEWRKQWPEVAAYLTDK